MGLALATRTSTLAPFLSNRSQIWAFPFQACACDDVSNGRAVVGQAYRVVDRGGARDDVQLVRIALPL